MVAEIALHRVLVKRHDRNSPGVEHTLLKHPSPQGAGPILDSPLAFEVGAVHSLAISVADLGF